MKHPVLLRPQRVDRQSKDPVPQVVHISDLPRVHHGSLLIFLACGINGASLGSYLYTRLGHEHGSLAYSWNSKKMQPRHSSWHPVEWRNFHNLPVLFFFFLCLLNEPFLYAHWVETFYTNITSFLWPSHLYWQFWNGETRSNLCASVLANTTIRQRGHWISCLTFFC